MSSDDEGPEPVVIDNGTWMCKAGRAGDKTAHVYEHTVIGRARNQQALESDRPEYVGSVTMEHRDSIDVACPMERGAVCNWDDMIKFWEFIFTRELKGGVTDQPMLITEVPQNDTSNREKMIEVLFETFGVPSLYIAVPADLALYSSGRTSGVVLDVGGAVTHVSAMLNCEDLLKKQKAIPHSSVSLPVCNRVDIGGNDITYRICQIVDARHGTGFSSSFGSRWHIEDMKHYLTGHCVADQRYKLPDGTEVIIDQEIRDCYKILFDPQDSATHAATTKGIDVMLCDIIKSFEPPTQLDLIQNVIISGGTTFTQGIVEKVRASLVPLAHTLSIEPHVIAPPERRKSTWLGGSILASLSNFPTQCKSKQGYCEHGAAYFYDYCDASILRQYVDT